MTVSKPAIFICLRPSVGIKMVLHYSDELLIINDPNEGSTVIGFSKKTLQM